MRPSARSIKLRKIQRLQDSRNQIILCGGNPEPVNEAISQIMVSFIKLDKCPTGVSLRVWQLLHGPGVRQVVVEHLEPDLIVLAAYDAQGNAVGRIEQYDPQRWDRKDVIEEAGKNGTNGGDNGAGSAVRKAAPDQVQGIVPGGVWADSIDASGKSPDS